MNIKKSIFFLVCALIGLHAQNNRQDQKCLSITCPQNYRCQDGRCLKQQRIAKKSLCFKHEFYNRIQAIRCTNRDYTCNNAPNVASCGLTYDNILKDFSNNCLPCLDQTIDYYYRLKCTDIPIPCNQNQECINGKCIQMFDKTKKDKNRKICNINSDCKRIIEICVANRCVSRVQLASQLAKNKKNS